jgi:hypothetical protein
LWQGQGQSLCQQLQVQQVLPQRRVLGWGRQGWGTVLELGLPQGLWLVLQEPRLLQGQQQQLRGQLLWQ